MSTAAAGDDANPHEYDKKLVHEGWTDLRDKKRSSTDILFVIILFAVWLAMTLLGFVAIGQIESPNLPSGNPAKLISPTDYAGRTCGVTSEVSSKPYGYFLPSYSLLCVAECPSTLVVENFYCQDGVQSQVGEPGATTDVLKGFTSTTEFECMYQIPTKSILRYCIPTSSADEAYTAAADTAFDDYGYYLPPAATYKTQFSNSWFSKFLADVFEFRGLVFGFGIGVTTFLSFLYLYVMRIPGLLFITVWTILISILPVMLIGSILMGNLATKWRDDGTHTGYESMAMTGLSIVGYIISFLYACVIIYLRTRIQTAIDIVKEACRALAAMPVIIGLPVLQAFGLTLFITPWIIYVIYLASSGEMSSVDKTYTYDNNGTDVTVNYKMKVFEYSKNTKYAFIYMLFCWFWTSEFIGAIGQLTVALAISAWYFAADRKTAGNTTVYWAFNTVCRYHLGTAAFGSLVIAIVRMIQAAIAYMIKKAKQSGNTVMLYIGYCLACCAWCLEKFMRFISKNAYISTAIYGYSFLHAAGNSFFLILRNFARVSAVKIVSSFVLILGKLFASTITIFILYLIIGYNPYVSSHINGMVSLLIFTWILSYFVASVFSEIFGMSIQTLLLCFIADEEMFPPDKRHYDDNFKKVIEEKQAQEDSEHKKVGVELASAAAPTKATPTNGKFLL